MHTHTHTHTHTPPPPPPPPPTTTTTTTTTTSNKQNLGFNRTGSPRVGRDGQFDQYNLYRDLIIINSVSRLVLAGKALLKLVLKQGDLGSSLLGLNTIYSIHISILLRLSFLFKTVCDLQGHCLVTLSLTNSVTLKWLTSLPILMQASFWWDVTA